jgi:hypothetical protein
MMVLMGYGHGRTNKATAQTLNTVFHNCNCGFLSSFIKAKAFRWTYIKAELTAPAGFFMNRHFKHGNLSGFFLPTHPSL